MAPTNAFEDEQKQYDNSAQTPDISASALSTAGALDEISNTLNQMLMLAELSASDANVDRDRLQRVLEHLKNKIDRLADCMGEA